MDQQKEVLFTVGGMHCAACSSRLERVLNGMDGVQSATVSLAANSATVVPDSALSESDTEALVHQIEERAAGSPGSRYGGHVGSAGEGNGRAACDPEGPAMARIRIHHPAAPGVDGAHVGASAARDHRSHAFARVGPQPCAAATCADLAGPLVGAAFLFDRPAQPVAAHPEHGQPCGDGHGSGVPVQPVEYGRGRAWAYGQGDGPVL